MKKVKKNMFQNTIVSLVIVVMVLFLSVPVNAQYSTQTNPMMQMHYTQFNPFGGYCATQFNPFGSPGASSVPGSDSMNIKSIPEPLEYLDSSWKDSMYWYRLSMEVYGWKPGMPSNYTIPTMWDAGSFTNIYTPRIPTTIWDTGSFTDIWRSGGKTFSTSQ